MSETDSVERPVRPRAWAKPTAGGDYLRSEPAMADTPEAEDGLTRCGWEPLYDKASLDAAVAAEREQLAKERSRLRETLEFIAQHFSSDWPERCQSNVLSARHVLNEWPNGRVEPA